MRLTGLCVLRRQIKSDIDGWIHQLETHVLDAKQLEPGKRSGNRGQRVFLRRIIHIQPPPPEHRDLESDFLNLRFRHPFESFQGTEAVGKGVRPQISTASTKGLLGDLAPTPLGALTDLPGRIEGDHLQISFISLREFVIVLKSQTKIEPSRWIQREQFRRAA